MAALDIDVIFEKLKDQGWAVERTKGNHWRAVPPDKTKQIVHFARMAEPRAIKNAIAELKRSGFVWSDELPSKRQPELFPEPPSSTRLVTGKPETFGQALRRLRQDENMEASLVAGLLDVTGQAVSAWEHDINTPITEHYNLLVELFPRLVDAPRPDTRDLSKPDGGKGLQRESFDNFTQPLDDLTPTLYPDIDTDLPQEIYAMNLPKVEPIHVTNKIVRFVKLVSNVKDGDSHDDTVALLKQARDEGMSINDVLEMLT